MSYQTNRVRNPRKRDAIFTEDGYRCAYCLLNLRHVYAGMRTVDHIVPRSAGGSNDPENLLTACHGCNSKRRDIPLHVWVGAETLVRLIRDYPRVARTIVESMQP